ncbi:hypothetical protein Tco_1416851, partial [Tanacetum coccineum]
VKGGLPEGGLPGGGLPKGGLPEGGLPEGGLPGGGLPEGGLPEGGLPEGGLPGGGLPEGGLPEGRLPGGGLPKGGFPEGGLPGGGFVPLCPELLEYIDVYNNDASESSQPSWGNENSEDIFSFGSALEDFICVVFVPDRNIISNSVSLASQARDYKYPLYTSMEGKKFTFVKVGVHSLMLGEVSIHMLVEKKYPLPQDTHTRMLRWKLHVNYNVTEMAYELLRFIRSQLNQ